jgi:hypothetical protein
MNNVSKKLSATPAGFSAGTGRANGAAAADEMAMKFDGLLGQAVQFPDS